MSEKRSALRDWFDGGTMQSILSDLSHALGLERLGPRVTDRVLWRAPTDAPKVALTFDDGPDPAQTPRLLEILDRFAVPATFFLIGNHIEGHARLAERLVQAGHDVGNHTYSHPLLLKLSDEEIVEEIRRTDVLLRALTGEPPRFLRPPMGLFSPRVLDLVEAAGYRTVVGDVYPRDSHKPGQEKIVSRVLNRTMTGSIIILHDGGNSRPVDRSQTLGAVQEIVPRLRERGFEFVLLSELADAGR